MPSKFVEAVKHRNSIREDNNDESKLIIWACHQTVYRLFQIMQTQWRTDFGARTGLDYSILPGLFDDLCVDSDPTIDDEVPQYDLEGKPIYISSPRLVLRQQLQIVETAFLTETAKRNS